MTEIVRRARRIIRRDGVRRVVIKLLFFIVYGKKFREELDKRDYHKWIRINERRDAGGHKKRLGEFSLRPKISVIVPVYNVSPKWLDRCIQSVEDQYYENWELCLYDDASSERGTIDCLKQRERKHDPRIKIRYGKKNLHISGASNEALKMATGEFVALLDHDDELTPDALFENVNVINHQPDADMIYSDEDKISETGDRFAPFFKPSWSLDLLLSHMYTGHLGVYRKSILDQIDGFRVGYEGSQDYDLVLRFIEKTSEERIVHIPKILYHWRTLAASTAISPESKNYAYEAGRNAISAYLDRQGERALVELTDIKGNYRIKREIEGLPKVSIVIYSQDQRSLASCLKSIYKTTTYENIEIIVVIPEGINKVDCLKRSEKPGLVFLEESDVSHNPAKAYNLGVKRSNGKYILFLNERIEAIEAGWLEAMIENIQRKEIGIVGGEILKDDAAIVSAGLVLQKEKVFVNAFENYKDKNVPYFGHHHVVSNCSAISADCLMIKKGVFNRVAGFDEGKLPTKYYDVDLCLKVIGEGYRILYTPFARFVINEEKTERRRVNEKASDRGDKESEIRYVKERWEKCLGNDPYYSPNLSTDGKFNINASTIHS
ncbi:MAG: glycosyltransferase [Syntrophales bacterium]|nr:glycosyltransferase [Syntrophales bacterium]